MVCTANDIHEWKDFPKGLRVLLLDGDNNSASEIRTKLEAMDYIVSTFCDENEALSAISSKPEGFHVAIVEVSTSSLGSFKILEYAKDLPIIMASNTHCLSTMMKCVAIGAVEFLRKPLSEEKLRNIWQHVVHKAFNTGTSVLPKSLEPVKESVVLQLPLFTLEEVIFNLEILALTSEDASMILQGQFSGEHFSKLKFLCLENFEDDHATFPYWFLLNISTLHKLVVKCSSFKELFQEEIPIDDQGKSKIRTRIEELTLNQLHDLQHICKEGLQIDPFLEDLKYLLVQHCSKLKYLVPSSVTCSRLTYLEVENCNGLIHLINSSTAKSMVDLKTMIIRNCNSLEQVVAEDGGEESKDTTVFISLEVLELECLPRLKMFCSSSYCLLELQWLEKVVISNCPRMVIFSLGKTDTPILQKVLTQKQDGKEHWQSDLNTTVNMIFQDMADQIVDATKQEIPKFPSSSDDIEQKENASRTDPQDAGR